MMESLLGQRRPLSILFVVILMTFYGSSVPVTNSDKVRLNQFILHYESLDYDSSLLEQRHQRSRRSAEEDAWMSPVHLDFFAHGREFQLRLIRDTETFQSSPSLIRINDQFSHSDVSHIYRGQVQGDTMSYVHGSIIKGVFAGRIDVNRQTFYVEKSGLYFKEKQPFHSVIYSAEDVTHPMLSNRNHPSGSSCGSTDGKIHKWMQDIQNSAVNERSEEDRLAKDDYRNKYTYGQNIWRRKRSEDTSQDRMCSLLLQSDPMLWNYMNSTTAGLGYTESQVKDEIVALFARHVDDIKLIYQNTTFQYNNFGPFNNITFAVHRMQINTSDSCSGQNANPFCKPNIDVANFLNLNSLTNHDLYCLAFVFTYRDFSGTLGLAWVGSNSGTAGGICEKWGPYIENNQQVYKSLNTGIVTLSNYGTRVPQLVTTLTFAHEVGHGFGSPHDNGDVCVPLSSDKNNPMGNYIMYASSTSGDKPNNRKFSPCSIGNMTLVIDAVLKQASGKSNCLRPPTESFCGNRIVEGNEQCDCGFKSDCDGANDMCCYPQEDARHCQRTIGSVCSPSEGPCCRNCSFVPASAKIPCQVEKECSMGSVCNGSSPVCPAAQAKPDLTFCNENTQICRSGVCTGSVCEKINWTACYMSAPKNDKSFDLGQLCYVSCLNPATQACVPTSNDAELQKPENKKLLDLLTSVGLQNSGIKLPSGAPCNNYLGYCDVFQKCRSVNEEGPLSLLTSLLFSEQALMTVREWVTVHWWAVLLMGVGFIIGMALFIKICAVHTPSSNPKKKPARKLNQLTLSRSDHPRHQGSSSAASDNQPIHSVTQGPPPGKRKQQNGSKSSKHNSTRHFLDRNDDVEMTPQPLHYDNQLVEDFDRI